MRIYPYPFEDMKDLGLNLYIGYYEVEKRYLDLTHMLSMMMTISCNRKNKTYFSLSDHATSTFNALANFGIS